MGGSSSDSPASVRVSRVSRALSKAKGAKTLCAWGGQGRAKFLSGGGGKTTAWDRTKQWKADMRRKAESGATLRSDSVCESIRAYCLLFGL